MQVSTDDFWRLLATSELVSQAACRELQQAFSQLKGATERATAQLAAQWLISENRLTRYQAEVLLTGRPGPFVFGPFTITDRIARGRLERLFLASYEGAQQVLLMPLASITEDPGEYADLGELANRSAAVKSPHVSRTFRATRQRGQAFVVLEPLTGKTLIEATSGKRLPLATVCQLGMQAALGLVAMHQQQLVHGSLAPQNLWLGTQSSLKILQFPLVAPASRARRFDLPLADYTAPELIQRGALPEKLSDIYSLGCVLYELFAGRPPFADGGAREKLLRHKNEFPERLDRRIPKLPEDLAELVNDMLAKDPALRCQSADEVAHVLGRFAGGGHSKAPPGSAGPTPGYGAWQAPAWSEPPSTAPPREQPRPAAPVINKDVSTPASTRSRPSAAPKEIASPAEGSPAPRAAAPASDVVIDIADEALPRRRDAAGGVPFVITETETSGTRRERNSPSSRKFGWPVGVALAAMLLFGGLGVWYLVRGSSPEPVAMAPSEPQPTSVEANSPTATRPEAATSNLIEDDGRTLWESPTDGPPLELRYLPSGSQVLIALRPGDLLASDEGPKLIAALGPSGAQLTAQLERTLGVPLADLEQLFIAFAADESLVPRASYVATLSQEIAPESLLEAWGNPTPRQHAERSYFQRDEFAYYLPETGDGRTFVVSTAAWMPELLESDGPPLLRSSIEQLLAASDAQRTVTIIANPGFLSTDGRSLLQGALLQLLGPLQRFLGTDLEAVSLSANLDTDLFLELRALATADHRPLERLGELRANWERLPEQVESHLATLAPRPHGADVLRQFPEMLKQARAYTRSGLDGRQLVLAAYLPIAAAHNLVMGAELSLLESVPDRPATALTTEAAPSLSADEALARKVTLSFPRETLEGALGILAREMGMPIVIAGNDLQLEGITRNQSLNDFEARGEAASVVLGKLLSLANPDGKLVYQVKPDAGGRQTLFVTTRAAVNRRGEQPASGSGAAGMP